MIVYIAIDKESNSIYRINRRYNDFRALAKLLSDNGVVSIDKYVDDLIHGTSARLFTINNSHVSSFISLS